MALSKLGPGLLTLGETGSPKEFGAQVSEATLSPEYDSDDPIARPEVGKVGVPINSLDDFEILFDQIPVEEMNTSMTINGTAMWLLALYVALARERGVDISELKGTTQNDLIKEYLARGTYIYPPEASLRIIAEMYEFTLAEVPSWNASNICSYHLQEAGATPVQEIAYSMSTALAVLDAVKESGRVPEEDFGKVVPRLRYSLMMSFCVVPARRARTSAGSCPAASACSSAATW